MFCLLCETVVLCNFRILRDAGVEQGRFTVVDNFPQTYN